MFTGIIKHVARVYVVERNENSMRLVLAFNKDLLANLQLGASVAIDGVCLTVVSIEGLLVSFDVIGETLKCTTLGMLEPTNQVHVERSARLGDEMGGHILSGHVFGRGLVSDVQQNDQNYILTCQVDPSLMKYILPKGWIAIDGVSLTLVTTTPTGHFSVHLIPETLRLTRLGSKKEGSYVNIEIDGQTQAIVDTVERYLNCNEFIMSIKGLL